MSDSARVVSTEGTAIRYSLGGDLTGHTMIVLSGWAILHVHAVLSVVPQYCLDAIETITLCNREAVSSHRSQTCKYLNFLEKSFFGAGSGLYQ